MRLAIFIVSSTLICACSVIGKGTYLELEKSLWKPMEYIGNSEELYSYSCRNDYYYEIKKSIGLESQIYALGFIVPIIPILVPIKHYEDSLEIKVTVVGSVSPIRHIIESANFYTSSDGRNFEKSASSVADPYAKGYEQINFNRAEISIDYLIEEKLPKYVYIKSDLKVNGCQIPEIVYKLEEETRADFTLHMGP